MTDQAVAFDLGGVLVDVHLNWDGVATQVGTKEARLGPLSELPSFISYQAGALAEDEYLRELADHLGLDDAAARCAHASVLRNEFPGVLDIVRGLNDRGVLTGCLSNTNAMHWAELLSPDRFPAVAALKIRVASHLCGFSKPEPEIYEEFERQAGLSGEAVCYFDDVPEYVAAASSRGWRAHLVVPDRTPSEQIREALSDWGVVR